MTGPGTVGDGSAPAATVRLLGFPLEVYERAREHTDELLREFTLLTIERQAPHEAAEGASATPKRLLRLVDELTTRFAGVSNNVDAERDAAIAAGRASVDLTYRVPVEVAAAARHLGELFDEADRYCRRGNHLLTLATPRDALRFRRWYLSEFERQIAGADPVAWEEYVDPEDGASGAT